MSSYPARAVALLATCIVAATPTRPRAEGSTATIYPLDGTGTPAASVADAQAMLEAALARTAKKGVLFPGVPTVVSASCGPASRATAACLARLANGGLLVVGSVRASPGVLIVEVSLLDGAGRRHGPMRIGLDPFIENPEGLVRALTELEAQAASAGPAAAAAVAAAPAAARPAPIAPPAPGAPVAAAAPKAAPPAPLPVSTKKDSLFDDDEDEAPPPPKKTSPSLAVKPPAPPSVAVGAAPTKPPPVPGAWKTKTGRWLTGVGLALVAGGATVGYLDNKLSRRLDDKFGAGTLTRADAPDYDRVELYNVVATGLLAAGGVATTTGLWFWMTAPDVEKDPAHGGVRFGVSGKF